jgi:phosphatidylserine/phosphatidylglycerophosphate/cardiolipin synthase-like enzyme
MSNLIVRADKEVYLATNYWQNSVASKYITNAMIELSKRAGQRGAKIVFKLIYDRGSPKQLLEPHLIVSEKDYLGNAVNLPKPEDIPNLDLEVMNYHKPMLGTFHCKYMIVDRKIAVLQSNNIQDNDNMEMMTHLEGPIVDSLYDMALISWSKAFDPPLPSHNSPAVKGGLGSFGSKSHSEIFSNNGTINGHPAIIHADGMKKVTAYSYENQKIQQPGIVPNGSTKASTDSSRADFLTGPTTDESVLHPARTIEENQANGLTRATSDQELWDKPYTQIGRRLVESGMEVTESNVDLVDSNKGKTSADKPASEQAIANGKVPTGPDAKAAEFFGSGEQTLPESQIEHPSSLESLLPEHTTQEPHYDVDIASEVARVQTAVSPRPGETRVEAVCHHLNHTKNPDFKPTAPECAPHDEMTPYIPHPVHEPFPIAMVNREPYGTPNHGSVYTPQNEAWLSALRNAEKNVFIQSPTLNAEPLIPAIIEACERGIDVYCYICLGYNDTVSKLLSNQNATWKY